VSAILTLGLDPTTYEAERNKQYIDHNTKLPIVMYPNPQYTPCPGQQIRWPYTITMQDMTKNIIEENMNPGDIAYILSSDGSYHEAEPGKIARVAYGGVGHIVHKGKPIAYIKYGGRLLSPPSAEL
jgi:hypothetical protein